MRASRSTAKESAAAAIVTALIMVLAVGCPEARLVVDPPR